MQTLTLIHLKQNQRKALELEPTSALVLGNLGAIYTQNQDYENALYYLKKAYDLDHEDPIAIANL